MVRLTARSLGDATIGGVVGREFVTNTGVTDEATVGDNGGVLTGALLPGHEVAGTN